MAGHAAESLKNTISRTSRLLQPRLPWSVAGDMRKHAAHIVDFDFRIDLQARVKTGISCTGRFSAKCSAMP
jgi:hypothetical protein